MKNFSPIAGKVRKKYDTSLLLTNKYDILEFPQVLCCPFSLTFQWTISLNFSIFAQLLQQATHRLGVGEQGRLSHSLVWRGRAGPGCAHRVLRCRWALTGDPHSKAGCGSGWPPVGDAKQVLVAGVQEKHIQKFSLGICSPNPSASYASGRTYKHKNSKILYPCWTP